MRGVGGSRLRAAVACTALLGALVGATVAPERSRAQDATLASGVWQGYVTFNYSVRFPQPEVNVTVFVDGGGPMLFEVLAGEIRGEVTMEGVLAPRSRGPSGQRLPGGNIRLTAKLSGGTSAVRVSEATGTVWFTGVTVPFDGGGATLSIDRVGCVSAGGRLIYPAAGLAAIASGGGQFRDIVSRWSAALENEVLPAEEQRFVEALVTEASQMLVRLHQGDGGFDRAQLTALIARMESTVARLSGEATCGLNWTTPLAEVMLSLLTIATDHPEEWSAADLEFAISAALRTGALPTADGELEQRLVEVLAGKLDAAIAAGSATEVSSVLIAATALGATELGRAAVSALGALR